MIEWLRRMLRPKPPVADPTKARHDATIRRADRLLRVVEAYRAADALRKRRL
jgi:hypothetical protein